MGESLVVYCDDPLVSTRLVNLSLYTKTTPVDAHALGRLNTSQDAARFITFLHTMENVSGQVFQLDSRVRRWI